MNTTKLTTKLTGAGTAIADGMPCSIIGASPRRRVLDAA